MSPSDAIAEVSAVSRQSEFMRLARSWPLSPEPMKILIGSEAACDWVLPGPHVSPRECLLRWDGQLLIASSFDGRGAREVILEPNAPLRVGVIELLLTPLASGKQAAPPPPRATEPSAPAPTPPTPTPPTTAPTPATPAGEPGEDERTFVRKSLPRHDEPTRTTLPSSSRLPPLRSAAPQRPRATAGEFSAVGPTQLRVPAAEPTVLIDATLAAVAKTRPRRSRLARLAPFALALVPLVVLAVTHQRSRSPQVRPNVPPPIAPVSVAKASPKPAPPPSPPAPPPKPIAVAKAPPPVAEKTAPATEKLEKTRPAPEEVRLATEKPAPATEKMPTPTLTIASAAPPETPAPAVDRGAFDRIGTDCRPLPPTARATPEEHALLQLAIEAYQSGNRPQAQQLFKALVCRPDVGPPARFMTRLLLLSTPATLPKDRGVRTRRLLDETARELEEHPDEWAQSEALDETTIENPKLSAYDFKNQPKCNIFIGEMLYRAGFIPPGAPAPGQLRVNFPNVNQMVARAEKLAHNEPWDPADGLQWFDVVPKNAAEPGDLVLIGARDRGDIHSEHGHVEIISQIVYEGGSIKSVSTVGARSHGVKLAGAGRVFGDKLPGAYQFSQYAMLVRPRMR
jgi:hypothetical protein